MALGLSGLVTRVAHSRQRSAGALRRVFFYTKLGVPKLGYRFGWTFRPASGRPSPGDGGRTQKTRLGDYSNARAVLATFSTVKPRFAITMSPGAEAP